MKTEVVISAGGTGGHMYPAQALADELQEKGWDVTFVGGALDKNKYFDRKKYKYKSICSHSVLLKKPFKTLFYIFRGIFQSYKILSKSNPKIVIGFGSYHTFPLLLAAFFRRIPMVLHEANTIPGRVNRLFAKVAVVVGSYFDIDRYVLKDRFRKVYLPTNCYIADQSEARRYFGLDEGCKTILIFGGSQGARSLNNIIFKVVDEFRGWQVIHLTGNLDMTQEARRIYAENGIKAAVKNFEDNMSMAWSAADFCITRSGAGTVLEQLFYEKPTIFIPYPNAADDHQKHNAKYIMDIGGAFVVEEYIDAVGALKSLLQDLLNFNDKLSSMAEALANHKKKVYHINFADLIEKIIKR